MPVSDMHMSAYIIFSIFGSCAFSPTFLLNSCICHSHRISLSHLLAHGKELRWQCVLSMKTPDLGVLNNAWFLRSEALRGVGFYFYSKFCSEIIYVLQRAGDLLFSEYTLRKR